MIDSKNNIYYNFLEINHFKKTIEIILKYYIYNYLIDNFNVWENNSDLVTKKIILDDYFIKNNNDLFNFFSKLESNINHILN